MQRKLRQAQRLAAKKAAPRKLGGRGGKRPPGKSVPSTAPQGFAGDPLLTITASYMRNAHPHKHDLPCEAGRIGSLI